MRFTLDEDVLVSEDGEVMVRANGRQGLEADLAVCGPRDEGCMALSCYLAGGCAKYEGSMDTAWVRHTVFEKTGSVPLWLRLVER